MFGQLWSHNRRSVDWQECHKTHTRPNKHLLVFFSISYRINMNSKQNEAHSLCEQQDFHFSIQRNASTWISQVDPVCFILILKRRNRFCFSHKARHNWQFNVKQWQKSTDYRDNMVCIWHWCSQPSYANYLIVMWIWREKKKTNERNNTQEKHHSHLNWHRLSSGCVSFGFSLYRVYWL